MSLLWRSFGHLSSSIRTVSRGHGIAQRCSLVSVFTGKTPIRGFASDADSPVISNGDGKLQVTWQDGHVSRFHHIWLRDHCQCPACKHESSGQKMNNILQFPLDVKVTDITVTDTGVECQYSDAHSCTFDLQWLREHCYENKTREQRRQDAATIHLWEGSAISPAKYDYEAFTNDDKVKLAVMKDIDELGFAWIKNVPSDEGRVVKVAQRVTPIIRETFYGRYWNVVSKPGNIAENVAYTSLMLFAHMDLMYFEAPPGLQLLHAKEFDIPESGGGETFWIDAFQVVDKLKKQDPEAFETLTRVPVTFHYNDESDGQARMYKRPIINVDHNLYGQLKVFFSPPWLGPLEVAPEEVEPFYRALRVFTEVADKTEAYTRRINQGECVIFNNRRLLHGRHSFDPQAGTRHLQGTYLDLDDFYNDYHVLRRRLGAASS